MKTIQKVIQIGFATCALASASLPALSWTAWHHVDFEWYANVGKPPAGAAATDFPRETRVGQIWAPTRYERAADGKGQVLVKGHWIKDDFREQVAVYSMPGRTVVATGPVPLHDRQGNPIPMNPESYPIDSARR